MPGARRRSRTVLVATTTLLVGMVGVSSPASAVHDLTMQLDGNTAVDATGPTYDWQSFFQGPGDIAEKGTTLPTGFLARGHIADYALPERTTFATGSKDTLNIAKAGTKAAGWQCGNSNNLGAKDDLVNVYTVAYRNPANQHLILFFGAEKSSNLGDNNIGIWFLQDSTVGCTVPASGRNTDFTGHHVVGDVLLTAAFTNGGTQANVEARTWVASTDNGGEGSISAADTGFLCGSGGTGDKACAITNLADFDPPWTHPLKTAGANGTALAPQEFYEGGVDVTQLQIDAHNTGDPCITTFLADTRSSQSPTATLFDFATGSFPVCHPSTTMTGAERAMTASPSPALTGQSVTFTAYETNDGTDPLNPPTAGNTGTFVQSPDCSPWTNTAGDSTTTGTTGVLDPGETWTFTCQRSFTSSGSKTVTVYGHGLDPNFSNKDVTYCAAADDTKICDADETNSITITVANPSTALAAGASTPATLTVHSGDPVTLTWTETNDATGAAALLTPPNPSSPLVASDRNHFLTANNGCTPAYVSGDLNGNFKLDAAEIFTFSCTLTPAVTADVTVTATGHGIDIAGDDVTFCAAGSTTTGKFCDADEQATQSVNVINPSTIMTGTGSALVTLTWTEKNDATVADEYLTPPTAGDNSSFLSANNGCSPSSVNVSGTTRNIGDSTTAGAVGRMDIGETWTFTCQVTVLPSTPVTVQAVGHGLDSTGADVTICPATATRHVCDADETQSVTITISQ